MLWKLFGSEHKVTAALKQSRGYVISFVTLPVAANNDTPPPPDTAGKPELALWKNYNPSKEIPHNDQAEIWDQKIYSR